MRQNKVLVYPSTSFSGMTALVAREESIGLSLSKGSCTIIPCTSGSSFNLCTVDKTYQKRLNLHAKELTTLTRFD